MNIDYVVDVCCIAPSHYDSYFCFDEIEFRKKQIARNLRITKWAREQVKNGNPGACFLLDGTMADPRWLDFTCDANDPGGSPWPDANCIRK